MNDWVLNALMLFRLKSNTITGKKKEILYLRSYDSSYSAENTLQQPKSLKLPSTKF